MTWTDVRLSNAKLGLLIFWPTFWTGFPVKMVIALLLLAAHVHPWEGAGLQALLILSVPVDIWALGLCTRTVLLERLNVDPPKGTGLRLWGYWAAFSVVYLPLLSFVVSGVKVLMLSATEATLHVVEDKIVTIPIAEKISLELVTWGTPTAMVLIVLLYGWLWGLGAAAQRFVRTATSVDGTFQDIVCRWDFLRVPKDQPLVLTAFTGTGVVLVLVFWGLIPVSTPHPHEDYEFIHVPTVEEQIVPQDVMTRAEQILARAEATLKELETDKPADERPEEETNTPTTTVEEEPKPQPSKIIDTGEDAHEKPRHN